MSQAPGTVKVCQKVCNSRPCIDVVVCGIRYQCQPVVKVCNKCFVPEITNERNVT